MFNALLSSPAHLPQLNGAFANRGFISGVLSLALVWHHLIHKGTNKGDRKWLIKVYPAKTPKPAAADIWSLITGETICVLSSLLSSCDARGGGAQSIYGEEGRAVRTAGRHFRPMIWRGGPRPRGDQGRVTRVRPVKLQVARALQVCGGASGICMMPIMNNDSIDQKI